MGKRILWLSNEKWTRKHEVERLIGTGYEVYCPKVCGYGLGESFLNVEYIYDSSLTLPDNILEDLNKIDLYDGLNKTVCDLVNEYFDIAFLPPSADLLRDYVHNFKGVIVLRFLGDEDGLTCTERLVNDCGYHLLYEINRIKDRFYFAYTSKEYMQDECDLFRGRGLFLPLPIFDKQTDQSNGQGRIMLNCPNIKLDPKANESYQAFFAEMKEPFVVFGEQIVPYEHRKELFIGGDYGELESAEVSVDLGLKSTLLTEPWAQAIYRGIPLVYLKGSKAQILLGNDGPGCCKDMSSVVKMASRIHRGDQRLAAKILTHQTNKLIQSLPHLCDEAWIAAMTRIEKGLVIEAETPKRNKKIGVLLTVAYLGGVLDFTKRFVLSLHEEIVNRDVPIDIVFAHVHYDKYEELNSFSDMKEAGITVREIEPKRKNSKSVARMLELAGYLPKKFHGNREIPFGTVYDDGIHLMMDCDYLINMTDRSGTNDPILPVYPYAVVAHDFIDRYSPIGENFCFNESADTDDKSNDDDGDFESMSPMEKHGVFIRRRRGIGSCITNIRNADHVFVTSRPGYIDAIQFAMVNKRNLKLIPLMYEMFSSKDECSQANKKEKKPYFVWPTNISKHKNHINALKVLNAYYQNGGQLNCKITGVLTTSLDPHRALTEQYDTMIMGYVEIIRKFISDHALLEENISFEGYLTDEEYREVVKEATFLFHPGFADNGNASAIDVACFGIPTLSNDYPAMRYLSDYTQINCKFTNMNDIQDAVKELLWMERNYKKQANLIQYKNIEKHSLSNTKAELYEVVSTSVGFNMRLSV